MNKRRAVGRSGNGVGVSVCGGSPPWVSLRAQHMCRAPTYTGPVPRALDKERLEGSSDQTANAARASSAGANPDDAAAAAATAAAPAPPPPAPNSMPMIFRTRPSARFGAPKPRPLYPKLEQLLDLMYRRLYWDPTQPDSSFSVDALLKGVRKVDKEMGP